MPLDKTKLGTRYTCFSCGTKFWDLNRPAPTCPECDADQTDAPVQDLKSLLARGRRDRAAAKAAAAAEEAAEPLIEEKKSETDDDGLFDSKESLQAEEDEDED